MKFKFTPYILSVLCFSSLSFGLILKNVDNIKTKAEDTYSSIEDIFNENKSLTYGEYSSSEYLIRGFVNDIPTLRSETNKISFSIVDDLNISSDNELVVFSSLVNENIHQGDEVVVNGYVRYLKENKMILTSYSSSISTTQVLSCSHPSEYIEKPDTVRMLDITNYFADKSEHTPISNRFQKDYQQEKGGYIDNAKKAGIVIDKAICSPNQKWHFFESWFFPSINDGTLTWQDSAKTRVYSKLQCPELLLWIYESSDVDALKVEAAYNLAKQGEEESLTTATIAKNMRSVISWEDLEVNLKNVSKITNIDSLDLEISDTYLLEPRLNNKVEQFDFECLDETVVSVSVNGLLSALKNGSTTIEVYLRSNHDIKKSIIVNVFDHGTSLVPLSVSFASNEVNKTQLNDGAITNKPLYIKGIVNSNPNNENEFTIKDETNDVLINITNYNDLTIPYQNDTVSLKGYIKKASNSLVLTDKDEEGIELLAITRGSSTLSIDSLTDLTITINDMPFTNNMGITNNTKVDMAINSEKDIDTVKINGETLTLIDGHYSFTMKGNSSIDVSFANESRTSSFYNVVGNGSKGSFLSQDTFKSILSLKDGDIDCISSVEETNYLYSGASGGRGDTSWSITEVLKIGTTSYSGSLVITTSSKINYVVIKAISHGTTVDIKIGDASHYDEEGYYQSFSSSSLPIVSKEFLETPSFETMRFEFNSTKNIKIATSNKGPIYIKSLEFGYENNIDQNHVQKKDGTFIDVDDNVVEACQSAYEALYDNGASSICRNGYTIQPDDWNVIKNIFISKSVNLAQLQDILSIVDSEVIVHKFLYHYDYIVSTFNLDNFIGREVVSSSSNISGITSKNYDVIIVLTISSCTFLLSIMSLKKVKKKDLI